MTRTIVFVASRCAAHRKAAGGPCKRAPCRRRAAGHRGPAPCVRSSLGSLAGHAQCPPAAERGNIRPARLRCPVVAQAPVGTSRRCLRIASKRARKASLCQRSESAWW